MIKNKYLVKGLVKKELSSPRYTTNTEWSAAQSHPAPQAKQTVAFGKRLPGAATWLWSSCQWPQATTQGSHSYCCTTPLSPSISLFSNTGSSPQGCSTRLLLLFPPSLFLASPSLHGKNHLYPYYKAACSLFWKKKKRSAMHSNLHFIKIAEIKGHLMKCRT